MNSIRLQKIIADSGYCSRRKAEAYIERGLVKVNGRVAQIGDKANPSKDIITVEGKTVKGKTNLRYIKMYKPRGYICSMSDPHTNDSKLVTTLLNAKAGGVQERVYPVGRLDANSEGLILLTNDGAFANKVAHPSNEFKKIYRVTLAGKISEEQITALTMGVDIGEGGVREMTRPCSVEVITSAAPRSTESKARTVLLMSITEGKNRQIRRMCNAVGLSVSRLKRVSIGGVKLGMLQQGEYADLTNQELRLLGHG